MNRKNRLYIVCGGIFLLAAWLRSHDQATMWQMIGACALGLVVGVLAKRVYQSRQWIRRWSERVSKMGDLGPNWDDLCTGTLIKAMDKDWVLFWLLPQQIYIENDPQKTYALRKSFFRVLRNFHQLGYMSGWKNPSRARLERLVRVTNSNKN